MPHTNKNAVEGGGGSGGLPMYICCCVLVCGS